MQATGDIISYFSPIILIVTVKRAKKSNCWKIYDIFPPCVFIFSPLGHAIIFLLSQTVYWGKIRQEGNPIIFFPLDTIFFWQYLRTYFNWGKIYDIFSLLCLYFFPLCLYFFPFPSHAIIVLLSQAVYCIGASFIGSSSLYKTHFLSSQLVERR